MADDIPEFDPSKPFQEAKPAIPDFDPSKPFEEVKPAKPATWGETARDIARQIPTALVTGFENLVTGPAKLLGAAGQGLEALGVTGDPERAAEQQKIRELAERQGGAGGMAQYLPEPTTPGGRAARTATEFAVGAAAAPGRLAVSVPAAVAGGLASEGAGQALEGTGLETPGRIVGAIAGSAGFLGAVKTFLPNIERDAAAATRLKTALGRDGDTPEKLMQRLEETRQYKPEATIADVAGNSTRHLLETVSQTPVGRAITEPFLEGRQRVQAQRLAGDLTAATGTRQSAYQATEDALRARKAEGRPLYQQAYTDGDKAIWSDELERLTGASSVKRAMHSAVRNWQDQAIADGYGAMNPGALVDRPGQAGGLLSMFGGKVPVFPNLQFWDYVKNSLDVAYKRSLRDAGPTKESARIATFLSQLRGELDKQVPSYAQARQVWAGHSAYLDALEDGKSLLSRNMTAEELKAQFAGMSESEKEAYRVGAVSAIRNQMMSNPAKMPDFTRNIRSDEMRRKLNEIMPTPEAAENFQRALSYEIGSSEVTAQSLGNSATAHRLAAKEESDSIYGQLAKDLLAHKMGVGWLKAIYNAGSEPVRRRIQAASDEALARLLTSTEPAAQITPRTRPSPRAAGAVAPTARGVGYGLATSLQDQNAQRRPYAKGGRVYATSDARGRPYGERALVALRKARERTSKALSDGRAQADAKAGAVIKPIVPHPAIENLRWHVQAMKNLARNMPPIQAQNVRNAISVYDKYLGQVPRRFQEGGPIDVDSRSDAPVDEAQQAQEAAEAAAARVQRRYPVREPDPVSLAASKLTWGQWLPSEKRALASAGALQRGEDYDPRDVFLSTIGAVGAPVAGLTRGVATLGAGAVRRGAAAVAPEVRGGLTAAERAAPLEGAPYPQFAEEYPAIGPGTPTLKTKPSYPGETYLKKTLTPESKQFEKARTKIIADIKENGYTPYFDPGERSLVDPNHYPAANVDTLQLSPKRQDAIDKYMEQIGAPQTRALLRQAYKRGQQMGNAHDWYFMGQLERKFTNELGPEAGHEAFLQRFAVPMAATTSGNQPTANLLIAHYLNYLRNRGMPMPTGAWETPPSVGGRFFMNNVEDYERAMQGGGYPALGADQPKMHNFARSFIGDLSRAVMDEQMVGGMLAHAGKKSLADPARKIAYGLLEKPVHQEAALAGVQPGAYQDVAWAGFKNEPGKPMIEHVNDAIERTHRLTGMPRDEIVSRALIRGEIPLYATGAVPLPNLQQTQ
jgi:hypothetical protein